jgi:PIN domain nuclease of toxin-antitoxin system
MAATGVAPLAVVHAHALRVATLPRHHADPFDRLLIAQALIEDVPVITADRAFRPYGVRVVAT